MIATLPLYPHFRDALDRAQAADIRADDADQRITDLRLRLKTVHRRAARHLAQIELGRRMRTAGVAYEPSIDHLEMDRGDGTLPQHWAFTLHSLWFALGPDGSLVVWAHGETPDYFECWGMEDLGKAVQALSAR